MRIIIMKKTYLLFFLLLLLCFKSHIFASNDTTHVFIPDQEQNIVLEDSTSDVPSIVEDNSKGVSIVEETNFQKTFIKMLITLVVIIALVFITFIMFKRLMHTRMKSGNISKSIKILEKRVISPKSVLYLIEVENKKVLIAESHLEIRPIKILNDEKHT